MPGGPYTRSAVAPQSPTGQGVGHITSHLDPPSPNVATHFGGECQREVERAERAARGSAGRPVLPAAVPPPPLALVLVAVGHHALVFNGLQS
jgi:hypothetical protein